MIIDNPGAQHIPALRRIWSQAFGDSEEFLDCFFETGFSYERCRCVLQGNEPVAAVYLFECRWMEKRIAYLYALAVEQQHQKQGLSRLLLTDTQAMLQRIGYAGAIMEPASESLRGYYESLGYRSFGGRRTLQVLAAENPIPFSRLGVLGYEQSRRQLLPDNGVLQEGAFTALLATQADFYGGDGFVAAVSKEQPRILEFLGEEKKIPGLLSALQWPKAEVRLPGGESTAVYMDFSDEKALPAYFGLPMD